jgi:hypothetical protein
MHIFQSIVAFNLLALVVSKPTVYLIRHGEKADNDSNLNTQGLQRAQCLRSVFGTSSSYQIGYIIAQAYKKSEHSLLLPNFLLAKLSKVVLDSGHTTL